MNKHLCLVLLMFLLKLATINAQSHYPIYSDTISGTIAPTKMIVNNDGTVVVLSAPGEYQIGSFLPGSGYVVCKYDANGDTLWSRTFLRDASAANWMFASDMMKDYDSGYVIVGDSSFESGMVISSNYIHMVKLDEEGNMRWSNTFNDSGAPNAFDYNLQLRKANTRKEYYVSDYENMYKFDTLGNFLFSNTNPGVMANYYVANNDGIIFGRKHSIAQNQLCQTDSGFNIVGTPPLDSDVQYYDVILTSDSCWLLLGATNTSIATSHIVLNKFTLSGSPIWNKTYNYNDPVMGMSINENNQHYFLTVSAKTCINSDTSIRCIGYANAIVVQTDTAGNEISDLVINSNASDVHNVYNYFGLQSIFLGDTLYTLGMAQVVDESFPSVEEVKKSQYVVWKNSLGNFVTKSSVEVTKNNHLSIFPNPATNEIYIQPFEQTYDNLKISITNLVGQQVYSSYSSNFNGLEISTQAFPPGIYLVIARGADFQEQMKLIVDK